MFYLHVPKTGGQTLATRLASAFDLDKVHFMKDQLVFSKDIETLDTLLAEKHFIESHVAGMLLSKRENLPILCTVREPVSQMLSNWRHILREKSNQWHRAAVALRPGEFFDIFGDYFTDHQTTYILSSFVPLHLFIERKGYHRAVYENFLGCVDRIRWLVPTESIDEFVGLWSLETKRNVPNRAAIINVAPAENSDPAEAGAAEARIAEARAAILARPRLYAFDQLLHRMAVDRFTAYRREVFELVSPWSYPDDSRQAYRAELGGVWLTENWYDPEIAQNKKAWWSGPQRISEVRIRRARSEKILKFYVSVVNGIDYRDIVPKSKETGEKLKTVRTPDEKRGGMEYSVSLEGLKVEDTVQLIAPWCHAAIMTRADDPSIIRRSFLASDWRLESVEPLGSGAAP